MCVHTPLPNSSAQKTCHILGAHSSSLRTHEQKWNSVRNFIFRENKPTERWCWLSVVPERQKWDAFLIRASHADTAGQPHVVSEPPISSTCPHRKTNIYKEMELMKTTSSCRRFILCLGLRFFLNKTKTLILITLTDVHQRSHTQTNTRSFSENPVTRPLPWLRLNCSSICPFN